MERKKILRCFLCFVVVVVVVVVFVLRCFFFFFFFFGVFYKNFLRFYIFCVRKLNVNFTSVKFVS